MTDKTPEDILREWCLEGRRDGEQFMPTLRDEVERTARRLEGQ